MGASVIAFWPGITEEQIELQPGFYNDCKAWGDWMAERESEPQTLEAIKALGAAAILTHTTDGMEESEVRWVTPRELREAAAKLREAVQVGQLETKVIIETYARNANGVDLAEKEFIRDLEDIEAITRWAEEEGATVMTLEVNW